VEVETVDGKKKITRAEAEAKEWLNGIAGRKDGREYLDKLMLAAQYIMSNGNDTERSEWGAVKVEDYSLQGRSK
jgi:hypothetical protein